MPLSEEETKKLGEIFVKDFLAQFGLNMDLEEKKEEEGEGDKE